MKINALQHARLCLFATSYTACLFATFMRPGSQGPKFTWENFPNLAASMASTNVMISMKISTAAEDASKKIVSDIAQKVGKKLVDEAGLI